VESQIGIMKAGLYRDSVMVDDYLAGEEAGEVAREFIVVVYVRAGTSKQHHRITQNIAFTARPRPQGQTLRDLYFRR
jgi:hypothetical protein